MISPDRQKTKQTLRELARTDLFFLLAFILRRRDVRRALLIPRRAEFILSRCKEVQAAPDGFLDLWAREHYKSTIITFAKTIQDILINPEITVGIFSHTRPNAKKFLSQIAYEFETNVLLKWLFDDILFDNPSRESSRWSLDEGIIVKRKGNPKEATVSAYGLVDGMPTGAHFTHRIYDDVVVPASVTTPEQIKKTTEAWEMSDNLGSEGGVERYIGTRYTLFDTYSVMISRGIQVRKYTATHNNRLDGKPVLFSEKYWAHKLKTQSRKTLAAQMMQNPMADTDATFQILWLRSYDVRPRIMNVVVLCDPSRGRHKKSDQTAMPVLGLAASGKTYLLDGYCHRMTLSQRWSSLRDLHMKWSKEMGIQTIDVGYERYGAQSDDEYFQERMLAEKYPFQIKELNWTLEGTAGLQGKVARVERLEPDFRNSRFFLPLTVWKEGKPHTWKVDDDPESNTYQTIIWEEFMGATKNQIRALETGSGDLICRAIKRLDNENQVYDLTERFIEEYLSFPFGGHDDLIDATSRIDDMDVLPPAAISQSDTDPRTYIDS